MGTRAALVVAVLFTGCAGDPHITEPGAHGGAGQSSATSGAGGDGGASGCAQGQAACDGVCIDVTGDPVNCGACGTVCEAQQVCRDGACDCPDDPIVVLATGQAAPMFIKVDETNVYWTDNAAGTVMKVPKRCGAPTML